MKKKLKNTKNSLLLGTDMIAYETNENYKKGDKFYAIVSEEYFGGMSKNHIHIFKNLVDCREYREIFGSINNLESSIYTTSLY